MEKIIYSYDEAIKKSMEYFGGDELPAKVFLDKYALRDNDDNLLEATPDMMHRRLAKEFARIEKKKFKTPLTEDEIFNFFDRFKYIIPQGSPMFGVGNNYQLVSLSNCFLLESPLDSYSSILQVDEQLVSISKRRGGCGVDLSNLRPSGTFTKNAARTSTGIITWMERYSNSIREVGQGGRRGALLISLDVHHPDVLDFVTIKNNPLKVTGANISLRLSKEFMSAVENNKDYELRFPVDYKEKGIPPLVSKMVSAKEIWKTIIHSAWLRAEPGLLLWSNTLKYTPSDVYEEYRSRGTNACSEINMSFLDSCRLLSLNLFSFVENPFTKDAYFNYKKYYAVTKNAQRLMDDLVDLESEKIDLIIKKIENDPEPKEVKANEIQLWKKIKKINDEGRRTGTGVTAVGDAIASLGIKYGSDDSIKEISKIYKNHKLACYESSVDMAEELGAFKLWDAKKEKDHPFFDRIEKENPELYNKMMKVGRRNVALTTTAPTGSVSILTQTSSGIEPLFKIEPYTRRKKINPSDNNTRIDFVDQSGDHWQNFEVYHPKLKMWMDITGETDYKKSPWYNCCAEDIKWENRIRLQSEVQKHVCHSLSSTINLPEDVSEETVSKIYLEAYNLGCKGITVYRKNCRSGVLIDKEKKEENNKIVITNAPKRPNELSAYVHHMTIKSHRYYVVVGLLENKPYEIFTGSNHDSEGDIIIPKNVENGKIKKIERGNYELISGDKSYHLTNGHSDPTADALTRQISTSLRHGTPMDVIVHQLEKTKGDMQSFAKVLARSIKKHIEDGTKVHGEKCNSCGSSDLERKEGCLVCMSCGSSACS